MKKADQKGTVWIRLVLCTLILAAGFGGFVVLKNMKKPPVQTAVVERSILVEGVQVAYSNFPVSVSGFGEVRSRSVVPISAEISGKVIAVHPRLEVGEVIEKGEVLVAIDDRDNTLDYETARSRLMTLQRDQELAVKEHKRLKSLYETNKAGTLSSVEKAESAVNAIADRLSQVEQAMGSAKLRLERSVIKAPFTCRVTEVMVEQHEYVTPGRKLITLTDDSNLEIIVSLDSRDVINWLEFDQRKEPASTNWFAPLAGRECQVAWTEDNKVQAKGRVDRIVQFDPKTRTVLVAVRLEQATHKVVSLVDGMFCRVIIPGLVLDNVVVLPRHAVSFENTVYVALDNRLQTRSVTVARLEQEKAVISGGLTPGETVVTTRLEQPLENSLLSVTMQDTSN
jgi:multidrug efflux system membrane fusion protein